MRTNTRISGLSALLLLCSGQTLATPILIPRAPSDYAPIPVTCPSAQLVRSADGISDLESIYINNRYAKASESLKNWLQSVNETFTCNEQAANTTGSKAPVIALTTSGGGYRSMLTGGGFIKGLDGREDAGSALAGLYQSLTYEAGLSGGAWLLSSLAGNDYPTISTLQTNLWGPVLQVNPLIPQVLLSTQAASIYSSVRSAIAAKQAAGFAATINDPWGRLLSYGLLAGPEGGVADTLSGIATYDNFTAYNAPFPIVTARGVNRAAGQCTPPANGTQYEFSPFEFGSWDEGVHAFASTQFLGTHFSNGTPTGPCISRYDNLGFVLGTSSDIFGEVCSAIPAANSTSNTALGILENLAELTAPGAPGLPESALFALYPNPFANFTPSTDVASEQVLNLVDGGVGINPQNNPIWPFLHRDVDVIIVNDNSADTVDNYPNGTEILNTYNAAVAAGLTRMPPIPSVDVFVSQHLNQKPTFFGCNTTDTATIIYLPNYNYTYPSGQPTAKIQYFQNETAGMINNGVEIATYGGNEGWPLCLACGITAKSGDTLPEGCAACLQEYCYN